MPTRRISLLLLLISFFQLLKLLNFLKLFNFNQNYPVVPPTRDVKLAGNSVNGAFETVHGEERLKQCDIANVCRICPQLNYFTD